MSDDRGRGISLRTKRKARPVISAPKQISGPIQQTPDVPRSAGGKSGIEVPKQRQQAGGKVMQLPIEAFGPKSNFLLDIGPCETSVFNTV